MPEGRPASGVVSLTEVVGDRSLAVRSAVAELRLDMGAVHDTRVAVRRLRALLAVFGPLLPDSAAGTAADLRWFSRQVGAIRDVEVVRERIAGPLAEAGDRSAAREVAGHLEQRALAAAGRAARALEDPRTSGLEIGLGQLELGVTSSEPDAGRAARLALEQVDALCAGFTELASAPDAETFARRRHAHQLHERRKQAKTVRAVTGFLGTAPDHRTRVNKSLKRLQGLLGEHHDAFMVRGWLSELVAEVPEAAALARSVRAAEREAMAEIEAMVPAVVVRLVGLCATLPRPAA